MKPVDNTEITVSGWRKLVLEHRITLSITCAIPALYFIRPTADSMLYGLPFILLGEAVRIWASGHIHKMREVTQTGPYALCRHPLYVGHFLITLGFLVAGHNVWLLPAGIAVFLLIFMPTMQREETMLTGSFGDDYRQYATQVPRFIPQWSRHALGGSFDWSLVRQHREMNNIAGLAGGIALFIVLGLWWGSW
ncbi:MAG: methyltransferase family protein [Mariprofundaceae bacterium]